MTIHCQFAYHNKPNHKKGANCTIWHVYNRISENLLICLCAFLSSQKILFSLTTRWAKPCFQVQIFFLTWWVMKLCAVDVKRILLKKITRVAGVSKYTLHCKTQIDRIKTLVLILQIPQEQKTAWWRLCNFISFVN